MAATKRLRKKYSPKRNPLAACRYANFIPKLAVSNEQLKDREVAEISAPYFAFIEALKAALEMAAWKHYVRAIKESEPVLDAEARRKRKKQEG